MVRKKQNSENKIFIDLDGPQGNAFYLLGLAANLAKQVGIDNPVEDMMAGNYKELVFKFDNLFGEFVIMETANPELFELFEEQKG